MGRALYNRPASEGVPPLGESVEGELVYKKIVVGTDGSPTAGVALDHAIGLAKVTGATVHIVNAYKAMTTMAAIGPDFSAPDRGVLEDDARRVCDEAAEAARAAGLDAVTHIAEGDPADALVKISEHENADLIVVGNRGMMGARRFITGSVPNRVAHHCPCHLLVVHTT
jgi:nucleotide-binding universal stress UspA family protein